MKDSSSILQYCKIFINNYFVRFGGVSTLYLSIVTYSKYVLTCSFDHTSSRSHSFERNAKNYNHENCVQVRYGVYLCEFVAKSQ